jgi:hypothetical protein
MGDFLLNPGDSVLTPSSTILYRNSESDSITSDVVNFLGNNTVAFNYEPITYTNLTGSNVYYYSATANDTIHFSITYYYCSNAILANDIISFSAIKENSEIIKLSWVTNNSFSDRNYEIQTSTDSTQFASVALVPAEINKNNYQYNYKIDPDKKGTVFFRLKITDAAGNIKYSEIRMIDIDDNNAGKSIFVYPNPSSDFINVAFDGSGKNWCISIFSSDGSLIQKEYTNISPAHINFRSKLSAGIYFIKAQSIDLQKQYLSSFIVR